MRTQPAVLLYLLAGAVTVAAAPKPTPKTPAQKAAAAKQAALKKANQQAAAKKLAAQKQAAQKAAAQAGKKPAPGKPVPGKPVAPATAVAPKPVPPPRPVVPQLPPTPPIPQSTVFQTNLPYDRRIDLKTDFVAVHMHGAPPEQVAQAIQSWRNAGYPVHRMLFAGSDAGRLYTGGKVDGAEHRDEIETDSFGRALEVGDRPYMVPTAGWLAYLKDQIRRSIDAGAEGIWPEEPLLHAAGGYSLPFKNAWLQLFSTPWQPPHETPASFFRASRLKSELSIRAMDELLRATKEYANQQGRSVKFLLPVHSPVSYASWNLVFPHAAASRLPVDGFVAQVWTGPTRYPAAYEGRSEPRLFESSWMLYSYFASLLEGVPEKPLYFLADPVEDNPSFSWPQYEAWYRNVLGASLLFPQARGFEVMPWPDRIFLPGGKTGGGTPAPASYLTTLGNVAAALKEIPNTGPMEWKGGTRGIGVVGLDTMMWQRGGPQGSSMRSLHGLVLPLLKRGVPVEIVPGERAADRAFLQRFKVLVVSYDMQKPLGPEVNQALAAWAKAGGSLVVVGGEDPYNTIGEWWTTAGWVSPTDHLLAECGVPTILSARKVVNGPELFRPALKAEGPFRDQENRKVVTLPIPPEARGKPVFVRFSDLYPQDGWGAWLGRVRVVEGGRARADFVAGSPAERPFLVEERDSATGPGSRFADRDGSFTYRFNRLGADAVLELELANQYRVTLGVESAPSPALSPMVPALNPFRVPLGQPVVAYPLSGALPLLRIPNEEAVPAWSAPAGQGSVLYCGLPAATGADSPSGADLVRGLVRLACERARLEYTEAPVIAKRGPYTIAHAQGKALSLKGRYLDLFHPDLPVVEDPELRYLEAGLFKDVSFTGKTPVLLHASHRSRILVSTNAMLRVSLDGPQGTWGTARIFPAGMAVQGVTAHDAGGNLVPVEARIEGRTLRVRYPQQPTGIDLLIRWIRPEARLTK